MQGSEGRRCRARLAWLAAGLALSPVAAQGADEGRNVRLVNATHRFAVVRALARAVQQLGHAECQGLLDEFRSVSGQPLRDSLAGLGLSAPDYLRTGVFFYDAPERACSTANVAVTQPGSRAVLVCGRRFVREMSRNSRHVEAVLIHEMLHSLGLGENPPTSDQITGRVRARCGQAGPPSTAVAATERH